MRALAVIAVAAGVSGCSILFNPDNVKVTVCDPLPVVAPLSIVAGDGTSLTWQWPNALSDAGRFKEWELCWGTTSSALPECRTFASGTCDSGTCSFTLSNAADAGDAGLLQYNKRIYGEVVARNACGDETAPSAASATPLNGNFVDTQGITITTTCDAGVRVSTAGELTFDQVGTLCLSTAMMGDELWRDATLDLDMRVFGDSAGGLGVRAPRGGNMAPRNGIIVSASTGPQATTYITRKVGDLDVATATASPIVRDAQWGSMRVSMADRTIAVEVGTSKNDLREVIRWRGPPDPAPGQLGLALYTVLGGGRVDVKNLRVRTGATIADGGVARDTWNFAGTEALHAIRRLGTVSVVNCPTYPAVNPCMGTCTPSQGSQCLELNGNSQATVDVPVGIDFAKSWRVKFKLAVDPMGVVSNPQVLRTTVAGPNTNSFDTFAGFPLIDATGLNWGAQLRMLKDDVQTVGLMPRGQWTTFELVIDSSAGTYTLNRDGMFMKTAGLGTLQAHLGAIVLGGGGYHGWFTDLEISQP